MNKTKIPWCDYTWNPITGCTKVSEGCKNCYAHAIADRFSGGDFSVKYHSDRLQQPFREKKPSRIFVCSMSDIFHDNVKADEISSIIGVIANCQRHTFIILTKRPESMLVAMIAKCCQVRELVYLPNLWLGVTVENQQRANERIPLLLETPACCRFISAEPLLERIDISGFVGHDKLDWVIAGPETGPKARYCDDLWIDDIGEQCRYEDTPFFDKRKSYISREFPRT